MPRVNNIVLETKAVAKRLDLMSIILIMTTVMMMIRRKRRSSNNNSTECGRKLLEVMDVTP